MSQKWIPRNIDKEELWDDYQKLLNENIQPKVPCEQLSGVHTKYDGLLNNYNQIREVYHRLQDDCLKLQNNPCYTHKRRIEIIHKLSRYNKNGFKLAIDDDTPESLAYYAFEELSKSNYINWFKKLCKITDEANEIENLTQMNEKLRENDHNEDSDKNDASLLSQLFIYVCCMKQNSENFDDSIKIINSIIWYFYSSELKSIKQYHMYFCIHF